MGNNQGNFQLHRFTTSVNIAKCFLGRLLYWTHTVCYLPSCVLLSVKSHGN